MKKLMLLSTGGTLACTSSGAGLLPSLSAEEILAHLPGARKAFTLDTKTILNLDSSNMQPEDWKSIALEVFGCLKTHDGVVVVHGTDTMAYTASMLSFMLRNPAKPVIITGSQLPIGHPRTDAKRNLGDALLAAASPLRGVHVVFDGSIMLGCRVAKVRTTSRNAFESINFPIAGSVRAGKVVLYEETGCAAQGDFFLDDRMDPNVFLLRLIPGTRPEIFDCIGNLGYKGVVIEGFGLGGVPCLRRSLLEGIKGLLEQNVAVLLATQCRYETCDLSVYEPGRQAERTGVLQGFDMAGEAAVTKLMWVLGHTQDMDAVRRMMYTNYCGEIGPRKAAETE